MSTLPVKVKGYSTQVLSIESTPGYCDVPYNMDAKGYTY